jgi:purine-binding chemotaxis protein CheW
MVVDPSQEKQTQLVLFALDEQRFALALSSIERAVRVVDVTPLPKAPSTVLGIVNVRGDVVPVYDLRRRFGLAERDINLADQLIIARTSRQKVALLVDSVNGVLEVSEEAIASAEKILPEMEYVRGVVKLPDGLVLIHDLDRFLSPEEERILDQALKSPLGAQDSVMRND